MTKLQRHYIDSTRDGINAARNSLEKAIGKSDNPEKLEAGKRVLKNLQVCQLRINEIEKLFKRRKKK